MKHRHNIGVRTLWLCSPASVRWSHSSRVCASGGASDNPAQAQTFTILHSFTNGHDGGESLGWLEHGSGRKSLRDGQDRREHQWDLLIPQPPRMRHGVQAVAQGLRLGLYPDLHLQRARRQEPAGQGNHWPGRQSLRHDDLRRRLRRGHGFQFAAAGRCLPKPALPLEGHRIAFVPGLHRRRGAHVW